MRRRLFGAALLAALSLTATTACGDADAHAQPEASASTIHPTIAELNPHASPQDIATVAAIEVRGAGEGGLGDHGAGEGGSSEGEPGGGSLGADGAGAGEPSLSFDSPLSVDSPTVRVDMYGSGQPISWGQELTFHVLWASGEDGQLLFSTWETGSPQQVLVGAEGWETLWEPLLGLPVGSRLVLANPTEVDGVELTVVSLVEVLEATTVTTQATGQPQNPLPDMPQVTLAPDGRPSISIPPDFDPAASPTTSLLVDTLIVGDGPVVTAGSTITVHYSGWLLDGTLFESSWDGQPASFPLTDVLAGWTLGLEGLPVGSQVMLLIPPYLAYGDREVGPVPANSWLIFVVDILGVG